MSGLLWLLVVFEGQESESESFGRFTETTTSLPPPGGFSFEDISSSAGTRAQKFTDVKVCSVKQTDVCGTLTLDVRDVESVLQAEDGDAVLKVEGVAVTRAEREKSSWILQPRINK